MAGCDCFFKLFQAFLLINSYQLFILCTSVLLLIYLVFQHRTILRTLTLLLGLGRLWLFLTHKKVILLILIFLIKRRNSKIISITVRIKHLYQQNLIKIAHSNFFLISLFLSAAPGSHILQILCKYKIFRNSYWHWSIMVCLLKFTSFCQVFGFSIIFNRELHFYFCFFILYGLGHSSGHDIQQFLQVSSIYLYYSLHLI